MDEKKNSPETQRRLIGQLCGERETSGAPLSAVIVAAHPDDETIGAGGRLPDLKGVALIHLTDGAPRNLSDAREAGFTTREEYADARRGELAAALQLAGIGPEQCLRMEAADQEASLHLADLSVRLAALLKELRPAMVLTHPYEGGHPDHDAAAFAVHAARRLLEREERPVPLLVEFTSYHARNDEMAVFDFIPAPGEEIRTVVLSERSRALKRKMLASFATQQKVLAAFPVEIERFRPAPLYDFTRPPHPGRLHYEKYDWGMTGARWRRLARGALDALGMEGPL